VYWIKKLKNRPRTNKGILEPLIIIIIIIEQIWGAGIAQLIW
jgi:hypothetical protein